MPKPRCNAEFIEGQLDAAPICVGCAGFIPDGFSRRSGGKAPKRMYATVPRVEYQAGVPAVSPGRPPGITIDEFGRVFGGNWHAIDAAARINRPVESSTDGFPDVSPAGFFDEDWL